MKRMKLSEAIGILERELNEKLVKDPSIGDLFISLFQNKDIENVAIGSINTICVNFNIDDLSEFQKIGHQSITLFNQDASCEIQGFAEYYDIYDLPEEHIIEKVYYITGAKPSINADAGLDENFAWAVCAWLYFVRDARRYVSGDDVDLLAHDFLMRSAGRVEEWWRWRRDGHDRAAVARRSQLKGQAESRETRNARREAEARDWQAEARRIAAAIWARNSAPSAVALAPKVREELARRRIVNADGETPSESRIRKAIAAEKPRRV